VHSESKEFTSGRSEDHVRSC